MQQCGNGNMRLDYMQSYMQMHSLQRLAGRTAVAEITIVHVAYKLGSHLGQQ